MADKPKNIAASVRQQLLNLARTEGQAFDVVLVAFGLERFIYRLSVSAHRDRFVLKGGMLVTLWTNGLPKASDVINSRTKIVFRARTISASINHY